LHSTWFDLGEFNQPVKNPAAAISKSSLWDLH